MSDAFKTSNYSMSDFYKVLKWIPRSKVDRQEPVEISNEVIVVGDSIVLPTIYEEFNGIDDVQVFINFNGVHVDVSAITLDFSPLVNGNLSLLQAKCTDSEIDYDNDTIISFNLDENITFTDETRILTGVNSIKIGFGTQADGVTIQKIIMRCRDYTYNLSDIENFLITGENHVRGKLGKYARNHIPEELQQYVYMASGAYAWLSRWEYEAKPMKESKAEADNYATRLLNQVNNAIAEYVDTIENHREHHDLFHAGYSEMEWGL